MSYLNCKWKQHYIRKSAKIMQLPRIKFQKEIRTKSIDDIFEKTKLNSQREENNEEDNILRNSDRVMYNWSQYFEQWSKQEYSKILNPKLNSDQFQLLLQNKNYNMNMKKIQLPSIINVE
ncbi:unnamed protein product [Paramecium primaurelia]|uniref:Uncharacterized protein n=1 Tax=Paramecium primaurelia TaxID=5886 RepID=A0A8S1KZM1_PARPR|nr:unnamed protein product [Paramecium primaurelia]